VTAKTFHEWMRSTGVIVSICVTLVAAVSVGAFDHFEIKQQSKRIELLESEMIRLREQQNAILLNIQAELSKVREDGSISRTKIENLQMLLEKYRGP
jgi:cytochrome c-type biogenesis protein CcmH/NrfG